MSRSALSSCGWVNSGGEPCSLSCALSLVSAFFDTAMAVPAERELRALSSSTQSAVEGLLENVQIPPCRSATCESFTTPKADGGYLIARFRSAHGRKPRPRRSSRRGLKCGDRNVVTGTTDPDLLLARSASWRCRRTRPSAAI